MRTIKIIIFWALILATIATLALVKVAIWGADWDIISYALGIPVGLGGVYAYDRFVREAR